MRLLNLLARLAPLIARPSSPNSPRAFLYVDPCTGDYYDNRLEYTREACEAHGVQMITMWSRGFARQLLGSPVTTEEEAADIQAALAPGDGLETQWADANGLGVEQCDIVGAISGSDAGLLTAERMLHVLSPAVSNGLLGARRDKYEMHETLRRCGLEAARQTVAWEWSEAASFLNPLLTNGGRAVIKPRRGMASVNVGLAANAAEAERLFGAVLVKPASLDDEADSTSVLLQVRAVCALSRA